MGRGFEVAHAIARAKNGVGVAEGPLCAVARVLTVELHHQLAKALVQFLYLSSVRVLVAEHPAALYPRVRKALTSVVYVRAQLPPIVVRAPLLGQYLLFLFLSPPDCICKAYQVSR